MHQQALKFGDFSIDKLEGRGIKISHFFCLRSKMPQSTNLISAIYNAFGRIYNILFNNKKIIFKSEPLGRVGIVTHTTKGSNSICSATAVHNHWHLFSYIDFDAPTKPKSGIVRRDLTQHQGGLSRHSNPGPFVWQLEYHC